MQTRLDVENIHQVEKYISKMSQCEKNKDKNAYLECVYLTETVSLMSLVSVK